MTKFQASKTFRKEQFFPYSAYHPSYFDFAYFDGFTSHFYWKPNACSLGATITLSKTHFFGIGVFGDISPDSLLLFKSFTCSVLGVVCVDNSFVSGACNVPFSVMSLLTLLLPSSMKRVLPAEVSSCVSVLSLVGVAVGVAFCIGIDVGVAIGVVDGTGVSAGVVVGVGTKVVVGVAVGTTPRVLHFLAFYASVRNVESLKVTKA
ncbi:hypothetical protein FF38_09074 [Lucilia cuprina]|uniref:Uncharacterized protein n=1 Tax=Lucilia cuprina TaxID=7375 RepID=A0A0L0BQY4_LUCCU|nr:hypothetical protein FF38_09074 [Lucilia cuprina]